MPGMDVNKEVVPMGDRVGIVAVAESTPAIAKENLMDAVYWVTKELLDKVGVEREEVGTIVTAASDVFHSGISCANSYYWEASGGFLKNASRQDADSLFAFLYACMRILSGHFETAMVVALTKGSENPENDTVTSLYADPFYHRPLGINETTAAALQMRQYMEHYGISLEQCAMVTVKNLGNALYNPYAHVRKRVTVDEVLRSQPIADPLTAMQCAPKSDGVVAVLLAREDKAKKLTDNPVWFRGYSSAMDTSTLGDRDLLNGMLSQVARRAYAMAGIVDPSTEVDVAEISEPYAFQELLWCEQLGLCPEGGGGRLLDSGITGLHGRLPVNPSGGVLATNAYVARGLYRIAEAYWQLTKRAGEHQVDKTVHTALAHSTHGFAGQSHTVVILGD